MCPKGVSKMKVYYNPNLTKLARNLRNNMTYAEKTVWRELKGKQFYGYDFHRQKPIGNFIADFYCFNLRLIIEIDGISHQDELVRIKDLEKNEYISRIGFHVLRFTDEEILGNWKLIENSIKKYIDDYIQSNL